MPHLKLEYSANIITGSDLSKLFAQFHTVLAEVGKINLQNCKSRAGQAECYLVGTGENAGFVHLDIRFLEGRSKAVTREIGDQLLALLKTWFAEAASELVLQITVEIRDIRKEDYFKYPEGTLTQQ